jgi:hypothetical protein
MDKWYQFWDRADAFIETDTWMWIEIGIMIVVVLTAVIVYFVRKFMEAWEE